DCGGAAASAAGGAWVSDPHTVAAACRAGCGDLEETAGLHDLATAAAVVARASHGPFARTRAATLAAEVLPADLNGPGRPPGCLEKLDLELHQKVWPRARSAPPLSEEVSEEAAAEDVAEGRHDVIGRAEVMEGRALQPGMSIA